MDDHTGGLIHRPFYTLSSLSRLMCSRDSVANRVSSLRVYCLGAFIYARYVMCSCLFSSSNLLVSFLSLYLYPPVLSSCFFFPFYSKTWRWTDLKLSPRQILRQMYTRSCSFSPKQPELHFFSFFVSTNNHKLCILRNMSAIEIIDFARRVLSNKVPRI